MKSSLYIFLSLLTLASSLSATPLLPQDSILLDSTKVKCLDEVVVTGTRTRCPMKNISIPIRVVSPKEIEAVQARSVEDLLQMVIPGVQTSTHGTQNRMSIRGLSADYYLFLIDGERMTNEGASSSVDLERIDPSSIERIEMLQGSSSALYGSNAIGGVINIITKRSHKKLDATLSGHYDTQSIQRYNGRLVMKLGRVTSTTTGGYAKQLDYDLPSVRADIPRTMPGFYTFHMEEQLRYLSPDKRLSMTATGRFHSRMQNFDDKEKNRYQSPTGNLRLLYKPTDGHSVEASYHIEGYKRDKYFFLATKEEGPWEPQFNYLTQTARMQYNYDPTEDPYKPSFNAGVEILHENLRSVQVTNLNQVHSASTKTLYGQMLWRMDNNWSTTVGIRQDMHSTYGTHLTPRLSIMWRNHNYALRISYSEGFRSPSLKELFMDWDHRGMFRIKGASDLKPEISHLVMITPEYNNSFMNISLSASYNRINNRIYTRPEQEGRVLQYRNGDKPLNLWSGTAMLRVTPFANFDININYALVLEQMKVQGKTHSFYIRNTRPHHINGSIQYGHRWGLYTLSGQFTGRYLSGVKSAVYDDASKDYKYASYPGYALFRASVTQRWQTLLDLSLTLGCDNLFNYMTPIVEQGASLSPGRSYFVSLSLNY